MPTDHTFKTIYGNGGGIYGPEATVSIYRDLYGFVNADFFNKNGVSIGSCNATKISIIDIGIGLKYLVPFGYGDFYVGLGALPTRLHMKDSSPFVMPSKTKWGCGGIAKIGVYFDLPKSFIVDLFFDYSFVNITSKNSSIPTMPPQTAHVSGCRFGAALGYRFN